MSRKKTINLEAQLKTLPPAKGPSFVEVVRPTFSWYEAEAPNGEFGMTIFPIKAKGKQAQPAGIVYPTLDTEEGRLIRIHELLHARYTPDVQEISIKAKKAGFSTTALQLAEDHRIYEKGRDKNIFALSQASMDAKAVTGFINSVARSAKGSKLFPDAKTFDKITIKPFLTTGKVVQIAVSLSGYPVVGVNPYSAQSIVDVCDPHFHPPAGQHGRLDVIKAQEIIDLFQTGREVVFGRSRKARAKRKSRRIFAELVRLIEARLVEGYASELDVELPPPPPPKEEPKDDEVSKDDTPKDSAGSKPSAGGEGDEDDASSDSDAGFEEGDGSNKDIDELFKEDTPKLSDFKAPLKKPALFGLEKDDTETPAEALAQRAVEKKEEAIQKARDIDQQREAGVVLTEDVGTGKELEVITPPSATTDIKGDELVLSLTCSEWAPMTVQQAPLARSKRNLSPRLGVAGIDGAQPKHLNRWFSDRAIMEVKGRRPGGAVLIDVSGSMSWTAEQTRQLVDEAPALTVALYSSEWDKNKGVLTIIARNGRVIEPGFEHQSAAIVKKDDAGRTYLVQAPNLISHGHGNCCDGPALLWLSKQPGPRIWFCDGNASGKGDSFTLNTTLEAFRLAFLAQATRTTEYQVVLDILRGKRKPNPVSPAEWEKIRAAADTYKRQHFTGTPGRDHRLAGVTNNLTETK